MQRHLTLVHTSPTAGPDTAEARAEAELAAWHAMPPLLAADATTRAEQRADTVRPTTVAPEPTARV